MKGYRKSVTVEQLILTRMKTVHVIMCLAMWKTLVNLIVPLIVLARGLLLIQILQITIQIIVLCTQPVPVELNAPRKIT